VEVEFEMTLQYCQFLAEAWVVEEEVEGVVDFR